MAEEERSQDDQVTAALAHGAAIIPFWGLIGTIVIWATQKARSRFVAFEALQALVYQALPLLGGLLVGVCYFGAFFVFFLAMPITARVGPEGAEGALPMFLAMIPFCIIGLTFVTWLAWLGYALYGATRVLQGRDFRYAVIGGWLQRYLDREEAED